MLHKRHNPLVTLAILLALFGVSKPARAFLIAQSNTATTTFTVPDKLNQNAKIQIAASDSSSSINQTLTEKFIAKYPQAQVNIETQASDSALESLLAGKTDLVAISRSLTTQEKAQGLLAIPVSREKIAIVVSNNNSYDGNLTIAQFAQIFRGEITDWSELGGTPGKIQLVDLPDSNDTRQAFPNYPVFQAGELSTGSNTVKLEQDSTDDMIAQLGDNGVGYAVANDVINRDDVKIVTMHQTQPDDPKYPFSQPFSLVYQGTPSEAVQAYLGFATAEGGNQVIASRIGSLTATRNVAIANGLANNTERDYPSSTLKDSLLTKVAHGGNPQDRTFALRVAKSDRTIANALETNPNADLNDSGEITPDVADSGEITLDVADSGEINPDVADSGEINPDVVDSGEITPDVADSGEPLSSNTVDGSAASEIKIAQSDVVTPSAINANGQAASEIKIAQSDVVTPSAINANGQAAPDTKIAQSDVVTPDAVDGDTPEAQKSENENKWWWWLPIIIGVPLLGAIAASAARRKKSDREPALGNIPDDDSPNGNRGGSPTPGDGGLSAVGANASDELGNSNATGIGNAAIATGGAATNFVGGRNKTEGDRVNEIPSNPVSEFTGQETKLQITDQPTQLQTNADDEINFTSSDEDLSQPSGIGMAGGAALLGGTAASGLFSDRDSTDEMTTNLRENDAVDYFETDTDVSQRQTNPQTTDLSAPSLSEVKSGEVIEADRGAESNIAREFRGDFVLDEETERTPSVESQINTSTGIDSTETLTSIPETVSDEIADSTTPELDLLDDEDTVTNTDVEVAESFNRGQDVEQSVDEEFSSEQNTVIDLGLTETVSDEIADSTTPELDLLDDEETVIDTDSDLNISDRTIQSGAAIAGGAAVSGFFNRRQDTEQSTDFQELDDLDTSLETTRDDFSDNVIADADIEAIPNGVDDSLEEITFDEAEIATDFSLDETIVDTTQTTSADLSLDEISFDDQDNFFNSSLDEITFDEAEIATDFSLDETIVDTTQTTSADLSLDEISFDDEDNFFNSSLDEITFDEAEIATDFSLDETIVDATQTTSTNSFVNNLDTTTQNQEIDLDDLGFDELESTDSLSFDLLSDNTAEITSLSDDQSNDMNNISEWLDSLDTRNQNTDNISEWLDTLDTNNLDPILEDGNQETAFESSEEDEDISFQFLEDLLERDANPNRDDQ
jgi:ABC-type phosphate transport system substrate-binding protein